jgi:hypothetical protein
MESKEYKKNKASDDFDNVTRTLNTQKFTTPNALPQTQPKKIGTILPSSQSLPRKKLVVPITVGAENKIRRFTPTIPTTRIKGCVTIDSPVSEVNNSKRTIKENIKLKGIKKEPLKESVGLFSATDVWNSKERACSSTGKSYSLDRKVVSSLSALPLQS